MARLAIERTVDASQQKRMSLRQRTEPPTSDEHGEPREWSDGGRDGNGGEECREPAADPSKRKAHRQKK